MKKLSAFIALLAMLLSPGLGWGQTVIYSTGFESAQGFSAGTNYSNTTVAYTGTTGQQWGTYYGTPSTTGAISGSQSMQMRWYSTAPSNLGYTFTNFNLPNVTSVSFKAANTSSINVIASYSTDGGSTYVNPQTYTLSTTTTTYTYNVSATGEFPSVRIKFQITYTTTPSTGARLYIDDVAISGMVTSPNITVGTITSFGNQQINTTSSEKTYNVSGSNLTANITITPPTGFLISTTSGSGYSSTPIILTQSGGNVASTPIYVVFNPTLAQAYSGNITHVSGSATANVAVSGTGTNPPPPSAPVATDATAVGSSGFTANWNASASATGYRLDVYTGEITEVVNTGFEGSTSFPDGWVQNSSYVSNTASNAHSGTYYAGMNAVDDYFYTPVLSSPTTITFWIRGSSATANNTVIVQYSSDESNWSDLATYSADGSNTGDFTDSYSEKVINANLSGNYYIRWFMSARSGGSAYFDDILIMGGSQTYASGYENLNVGNVTSYSVTSLDPATDYHYVVRAVNDYGTSGNSNIIDVSTTASSEITFYFRGPSWMDNDPHNPEIWGPYNGWATPPAMTYDAGIGWWYVTVEVADPMASIEYQSRFAQGGSTKYQKAFENFGANATFTTTTGEIWIDASLNISFTWSGNDFYLAQDKITESQPIPPVPQIDWANLQSPASGSIVAGGIFNVYAQVYEQGLTDASGQGAGITAWIGYSTSDTDPSTWTNWVAATYNGDAGNNDEYMANLASGLTAGTYYYASRFQLGTAGYVYGGFNGGFWDGTTNVSGELTLTVPFMIINEVDADTPSNDTAEFIELYDGGVGNVSLNGFVVVLYNGNGDVSYEAYDLDGYSTDANGYFVIGSTGMGTPIENAPGSSGWMQNGADAVALYYDNATTFPNGTAVTIGNLIDALVYDTNDDDDAELLVLLNTGEPQINEAGRGSSDLHSMQRLPNGSGGARNTSTYDQTYPTPGAANTYLDITWTGVTDTDWATATNWNPNIVPDIVANAIIPDVTNDPVISTTAICKDISIAASAIVEVAPNGTLTVDGTLTNNAGATGLLVKSDGTSTGSLIHNTASVPATIERYVSAANWATASDGWHLLSSPVASQSISGDWTPTGIGNDYDMYVFDETKLNEYWLNQKVGANNITTFETGKGYLVAYEQSATKAFTGNVNVADVTLSGLTNTVGSAFPGWHLVGNPFASAIDYDLGTWTKTNIDAEIQVWNSAAASYQTATEVGGIVPSMNGFMAHTSGTGVLTIPADSRTHNAANWYKSDEEFILLKAKDIETGMSQSSIVRFNPMATDTYDADFDSYFLQGFAPAFYSANANEVYALNTLPEISNSLAIPFGFTKNGSTSFSIELAKSISGATIYLTDKKAGITTNLTEAGSYNFTASEGDDANRFTLHFGSVGIDDLNSSSDIDVYANSGIIYLSLQQNANATVKVYNLTGQLVLQSKTNGKLLTTLNASALNSGVYVVSVNSGDQVMSKKVVIRK